MVYKFVFFSDEVDNFYREIKIDADATFFQLHEAILDSVEFSKDQITSFFLCTDQWEKEQEITLFEMDSGSEYDNYVMESTVLRDFVTEEKQRMIYVFDNISDRAFFMELKEIILGSNLSEAVCSLKKGIPPKQIVDIDSFVPSDASILSDDDFYGSDGYNDDDLSEGFGDMDFEDSSY
ncbi:MAG: hypothetical protein J6U44_02615 [Paludibacteraceae bacterium]|nr:hypothetical protein [Paludibacteraceae bacterium]